MEAPGQPRTPLGEFRRAVAESIMTPATGSLVQGRPPRGTQAGACPRKPVHTDSSFLRKEIKGNQLHQPRHRCAYEPRRLLRPPEPFIARASAHSTGTASPLEASEPVRSTAL